MKENKYHIVYSLGNYNNEVTDLKQNIESDSLNMLLN